MNKLRLRSEIRDILTETGDREPFDWRLIKAEFKRGSPGFGWWGDDLDVRFVLMRLLRRIGAVRLLDIGCGVGRILATADARASRFGLDISRAALLQARRGASDLHLLQGSLGDLPVADSSCDIVVLGHIVEALPPDQLERLLAGCRRVLGEGGKLFITTPNAEHWCYRGMIELKREKLAALLEQAGFDCHIMGYNPIPSLFFFAPAALENVIPHRLRPYFTPHSWLFARIEWARRGLDWLMLKGWGGKTSKGLLVVAQKRGD